MIQLRLGDSSQPFNGCRNWLFKPVHLTITSPPYNVGIDYSGHADNMSKYAYENMLKNAFKNAYNMTVSGGRIAVVVPFGTGRNPWVPFTSIIYQILDNVGYDIRGQIIWDKGSSGNRTSWGSWKLPTNPCLRDTCEAIIIGQRDKPNLICDGLVAGDNGKKISPWLQDSNYFMELAQDHWKVALESAKRVGHPAPFPKELVRRLIHFYGFPGCHVYDPFAGSGTVGVVCKELGCDCSMVEISQKYCELIAKRIQQ